MDHDENPCHEESNYFKMFIGEGDNGDADILIHFSPNYLYRCEHHENELSISAVVSSQELMKIGKQLQQYARKLMTPPPES